MRKLLRNDRADMNMILAAIIMAITLAIGLIVIYNVVGSIDASTIDTTIRTFQGEEENGTGPMGNATSDLVTNINTFYTVGPIALIVVAAVGILSYVLLLRRRG